MKREIWLDFLRVTACFLVMIVHSTEPFYLGSDGGLILSATDAFWVALFEGLSRCCVPVFLPLYGGKRGGLAFLLWLSEEFELSDIVYENIKIDDRSQQQPRR